MKKFINGLFILTLLLGFKQKVEAQVYPCAGITVSVLYHSPQEGATNKFGVKVTLDKTYSEDITVIGTIVDSDNPNNYLPFSLTVTGGLLTEETYTNYFSTGPTSDASITTSSVSPSTATSGGITFGTQSFSGGCGNTSSIDYVFSGIDLTRLQAWTTPNDEGFLKTRYTPWPML